MNYTFYNPIDLSSFRSPFTLRQENSKNLIDEPHDLDLNTIGSKDIEVNHGSPIGAYTKESPMNYYFNTLKKDQKIDDFNNNDSEIKNDQKELLNKEIIIPKFPDLSNTKAEEDNFEMNSKDFLENNRIIRNDLLHNHFFQKKINNDFIKEIYDSINNDEKFDCQINAFPYNNQQKFIENKDKNFMLFESFNDNVPKIINTSLKRNSNEFFAKTNNYFENEIAQNLHHDTQKKDYIEREFSKNTPEFQKFQTKITNSTRTEEYMKAIPKKAPMHPSGTIVNEIYSNNNTSKCSKNNYDLPLKYDDKYSEILLKRFDLKTRNSTENFDENIDENLSKDLRKKLDEHLSNNRENTSKFSRVKKVENLYNNRAYINDDMTSFKNMNSSVMNQNSDRLKSSPIISIHIHESIKKDLKAPNEKKSMYNEFKFLEDYKLESVKRKLQNELANKNSTTVGLSSIENTDNNSEKPLYVLNMEIISSNCLSPIVKENIINLLKSNSNYVNSNESLQFKEKNGSKTAINEINELKIKNNEKIISGFTNFERIPIENPDKKPQVSFKNENLKKIYERKFSLSNLKNIKAEDIFSNKKLKNQYTDNKVLLGIRKKSFNNEIFLDTPQNRITTFSKAQIQQQEKSKSKSKSKEKNLKYNITKQKKTHFKNLSNPNVIHKNFEEKQVRREKNTSFHSKNFDPNVSRHDISTNLISNAYLPHVKTKQTISEYELFKKQKQQEKTNINMIFDKKQLHLAVKQNNFEKTNNGKSEKKFQNKSALIENKENVYDKINELIKKQNMGRLKK